MKNTTISRKKRSEKRLTEIGIIFNENLPQTYERNNIKLRTSEIIAIRIISLWEVINNSSNQKKYNKSESIEFLKEYDLWEPIPKIEKLFLESDNCTNQEIIDFTWRIETIKVLYWVLGEIDSLNIPIEDKDIFDCTNKVHQKYPSVDSFIEQVKLRDTIQILDEADFMYRLHWASKKQRRELCHVPKLYNYSVIRERDFALRWITDVNTKWDDVSCDT